MEYNDIIEQILNRYLQKYNLDTNKLDYFVKNILVNYSAVYETTIDDMKFLFSDGIISNTVNLVTSEINYGSEYNFRNIDFKPGDTVIDIGGNIGMVSIYLAKKFPFLKIYAFEPLEQNYLNFVENIKLNNIPQGTITVEHKAVTSDGRDVNMSINALNTGGSSISDVVSVGAVTQERNCGIKSTTLENIMKKHKIKNLKLLKIDCEGAEYEILHNTSPEYLKRIEILRGEFHENKALTNEYDIDELIKYTQQYISDITVVQARGCFIM